MRKSKAILLFVSVLFISIHFLNAQEHFETDSDLINKIGEIVPNSPEATAFAKYGEVDISLYTGSANLSVPLCIIDGKEMNLPLSLSYDSSGIKVSQISTSVGLGWNLRAGGMVTRQVQGLPDGPGGHLTVFDEIVQNKLEYLKITPLNAAQSAISIVNSYRFIDDINLKQNDTKPDTFSFSVNNLSGDIVIDYKNDVAYCINNPDVKVTYTIDFIGRLESWVIIDTDGTRYEFSQPEITDFSYEVSSTHRVSVYFHSAWYLTKIISPLQKDTYDFVYNPGAFWDKEQLLFGIQSSDIITDVPHTLLGCIPNTLFGYETYNYDSFIDYKIKQPYLTSINHNTKNVVDVLWNNNFRLDLEGRKALNGIEIKDNNNVIKKVNLNQSYFQATGTDEIDYRLKLDEVVFEDPRSPNQFNEKYTFDYYDEYTLPSRDSKAIDLWGYYNGASNTHLIPRTIGAITQQPEFYELPGADRDPNINYSKSGTLKKINYPTGGYSELYYQSHYLPAETNENQVSWYTESLGAVAGGEDPNDTFQYRSCDHNIEKPNGHTQAFVIEEQYHSYEMEIFLNGSNNAGIKKLIVYKLSDTFNCETDSNGELICTPNGEPNTNYCEVRNNPYIYKAEYIYGNQTVQLGNLSPGSYAILMLNSEAGSLLGASIKLKKKRDVTSIREIGGLRIYKTSDFLEDNNLAKTKYYVYDDVSATPDLDLSNIDINKFSSAILQEKTRFFEFKKIRQRFNSISCEEGLQNYGYLKTVFKRFASNQSIPRSPHVSYSSVSIINSDNGIEVNNFYNDEELSFPSVPYSREYVLNGRLKKKQIYNSERTLQYEESHNFNKTQLGYVQGLSYRILETFAGNICLGIGCTPNSNQQACGITRPFFHYPDAGTANQDCWSSSTGAGLDGNYDYQEFFYAIPYFSSRLTSSKQKTFFGSNLIATETVYHYDNPLHNQPTRVVTTTSPNNETLVTKTTYPQDIPSDPYMADLIAANRIAEPIETETYIADSNGNNVELLSKQKTRYFNSNGLILPRFVQTLKGQQTGSQANLETRINYNSYDSYGNPTDVSQTNGTRISYIWGYNGQYPVAKIENKAYTALPQSLVNQIKAETNEAALTILLDQLRTNLPDAMVSTYTYKPLIGVHTMTDPRGYKMTYHYDEFNRLEYLEDQDGKILSKNEYNYRD